MTAPPRSVRIARAVQRACLVLAPRDVREAYRAEMVATFEAASADAGAQGVLAVCRLLLREIGDLASTRLEALRREPMAYAVGRTDGASPSFRLARLDVVAWRQAWRSLARRPAFFAVSVSTLAFGAGLTTAMFSLVDTVLIKPLPYPDPDALVTVFEASPSAREKTSLIAPGRLEDWRRRNRSFSALSGSYSDTVTDTSGHEPERLEARRVTPGFFSVYAMPPLAGRWFTDAEEQPSGPGAAILGERLWTRRFQRDPAAIGRSLTIGGEPYEIVGVMPSTFTSAGVDVWLPAQIGPGLLRVRAARFLGGIGRLRPGVSAAAAASDLVAVQAGLAREFPETDAGWSAEVRPLKASRVGTARRGLVLVFGAVASLWLIAVANVAGLTLVQLQRRAREITIRAALGASRARVVAGVAREGIIVAVLGGALAGVLAAWIVRTLPRLLTQTPRINELTLDWRALAFTAGTSLLAVGIFSVVPALAGSRLHLTRVLAAGSRAVAGGRHGLQKALVVGQVAVSLLLVGSAMLLMTNYYNLTRADTGFNASSAMTFHVGARWDEDRLRIGRLQEQLLERLEQLPHVQAAGMTNFLPASGATLRYQVSVEGLSGPNADGSMTVGGRMSTAGYLRAIRAPLIAGSWCTTPRGGDFKAPVSAMLNRRFVEIYAQNQNLIGRTLRITQGNVPFTIAGIIGDLAEDGQATAPAPYVYTCAAPGSWPDPNYVARTTDPRSFSLDLRRIVRELDSERAVFGLQPLQAVLDAALDQPRMDAAMLGLFAAAAVMLAAIGLYSLFMLLVSEQAREMAVRLALGAAPREMFQLVMADAGRLLAIGIVLGLALTAAAGRVLRGTLTGASGFDATAMAVASIMLALVAMVAVAAPALRAARIAPVDALHGD